MKLTGFIGPEHALALGIFADVAFTAYSSTNSSPQTTELFAGERLDTLWKWVRRGDAIAVGYGIAGALVGRSPWPLIGAGSVAALMHWMYYDAVKSGTSGKG